MFPGERVYKSLDTKRFSLDFDCHPIRIVQDEAGEAKLPRKPMRERAEPNALNNPLHNDLAALCHVRVHSVYTSRAACAMTGCNPRRTAGHLERIFRSILIHAARENMLNMEFAVDTASNTSEFHGSIKQ